MVPLRKHDTRVNPKGVKGMTTVTRATTAAIAAARGPELPHPAARVAIRNSARLTQAQVGQIVGVTGQMVGLWEKGANEPTGERRERYAKFLQACLAATP
jgi:DNA-binding transcriptional regulator YiaG